VKVPLESKPQRLALYQHAAVVVPQRVAEISDAAPQMPHVDLGPVEVPAGAEAVESN